jgi:hypothetical protein
MLFRAVCAAIALSFILPVFLRESVAQTQKFPDGTKIYQCVVQLSQSSGKTSPEDIKNFGPTCLDIFQNENRNRLAEITNQIYETQRKNGVYILVLVVIITVFGLGLSTLQLYWGYNLAKLNRTQPSPPISDGAPPQAAGVTQMKFSKDGFEISSSVAGLIILAFSLAFFITYVWKVYPIQTP